MAGEGDLGDRGESPQQRLTPAMEQYRSFKEQYPGAILFFHIGDFYETFGPDAELVSRELDIALTSRSRDRSGNRIPLAGVPHDAAEGYIGRLVAKGYRVAVCDQVEDPAASRGIVRRAVTRVVTPGTATGPGMGEPPVTRYLAAVWADGKGDRAGLAFLDTTTGEFFASVAEAGVEGIGAVRSEIVRYRPAEAVIPPDLPGRLKAMLEAEGVVLTVFPEEAFIPDAAAKTLLDHFRVDTLAGFGCDSYPEAVRAAGAALRYAAETMHSPLGHVTGFSLRVPSRTMLIDAITLRNLEIFEGIRGQGRGGTLFSTLDLTMTAMGRRELRRRLAAPLLSVDAIRGRLDAVEFFLRETGLSRELRGLLGRCADVERIAGRIATGTAGPRDLVAMRDFLLLVPKVRVFFPEGSVLPGEVRENLEGLGDLHDAAALIARAIADDPPAAVRQGGVIREGYSADLDGLRSLSRTAKDWVLDLQQKERERTGIRSLRVSYNQVFGYYIEITKANLHLVPPDYTRKQTTAGGERFVTGELADRGAQIASADEKILALEAELYGSLVRSLQDGIPRFQAMARGLAGLDVASSLAEVARVNGYTRPVLDESLRLAIREGRHPVVERSLGGRFVPNDTQMDGNGDQILIITGANMAGKSTYMRGVAEIAILAQTGSFVPAAHATIGIVDRVFTRVGAFDDLASGQSTFMVEMLELANILNGMTERSLIVLDEIGKGTGTLDGYAIARSVLEFLHGRSAPGPRTLFATHFHEIVGVEAELRRVKNYHFTVKETGSEVVFLRRLVPGATDRSYGIHVARRAGIPRRVTDRAAEILASAQKREDGKEGRPRRYTQVLFVDSPEPGRGEHPVMKELRELNPDGMTPLQALETLFALKKQAREEGEGNGRT
jgi:DNA mismatch repair protein MutS